MATRMAAPFLPKTVVLTKIFDDNDFFRFNGTSFIITKDSCFFNRKTKYLVRCKKFVTHKKAQNKQIKNSTDKCRAENPRLGGTAGFYKI